jgi:hypothetical protein
MRVATVKTDLSAGFGSPRAGRAEVHHSSLSIIMPDILVPALWSGIGLVVSVPFIPWLSNAVVEDATFGFLVSAMG